jgi:hypothetical protein
VLAYYYFVDDFTIEGNSAVFPLNSTMNSSACFTLSPVNDEFIEEDEVFMFNLRTADERDVFKANVSDLILVTINDNDGMQFLISPM